MRPIEKIRANYENKLIWQEALDEIKAAGDPQYDALYKAFLDKFKPDSPG